MEEINLYNIDIQSLNSDEQTELISHVLSKNIIDIYRFMFFYLDKATLSDDKDETEKIYSFLRSKKFNKYGNKIVIWCNISHDEEFKFDTLNRNEYLELEIANSRLIIANGNGNTYDIETLKKYEYEYTKNQRILKLKNLCTIEI
jgi:UDP-N-acetylglucosamine transferase subunit ALG13